MLLKERIIYILKSNGTQVFDSENRGSTCVALTEGMDLPDIRHKCRNMTNGIGKSKVGVVKLLLLLQIIFQRCLQLHTTGIQHRVAVQYPFFFGYVVVSELPCVLEDTFEYLPMDGRQTCHTERK